VFSQRTHWDTRPNRLTRALTRKRKAGVRLLDLTESNPTVVGLPPPTDLLALLGAQEGHLYAPTPTGLPRARTAVADAYARRGVPVDPEHVILTASSSEAYAFLFKVLCDPGDTVLVPHPSYPLFEFLARVESVETASYPLTYDGRWQIDEGSLREVLAAHPRARAIVVVSPNNPTGSLVGLDEWELLHTLAERSDLALIGDEVFADFIWDAGTAPPPSFATAGPALSFALGGLSKSCGLPQLKLGWIIASGPHERCREALARLDVVADTFLSVSTPIQLAAPRIVGRNTELSAPILERVQTNRRTLERLTSPESPFTLLRAEGGWSSVIRAPATISEDERVLRLLERTDVLAHPGYFFDFPREAYLIVSLLPEPTVFTEGIARILADEA